MQQNVKTGIQIRSLRDIMVTPTPYLVFELIIILNIFSCHSFIVHSGPSCIHLIPCFGFMKPLFVPSSSFVFNLPLNEIARTQFFVRWVDCNTPFPEYVLSCVFRFSIVFFELFPVFILYYEFLI